MDTLCVCGRPLKHTGRCRGSARKYVITAGIEQQIRTAYHQLRTHGNRRALPNLSQKLGWPKHVIAKHGRELGLARAKEKPWSAEEKALLEKWAHLSLPRICLKLQQAGFKRSETGIKLKMRRLLITRDTLGYYSATNIAAAMGIDSHKVTGWIRRGWLRAEKKGTHRTEQQGGDSYLVHSQRTAPVPSPPSGRIRARAGREILVPRHS